MNANASQDSTQSLRTFSESYGLKRTLRFFICLVLVVFLVVSFQTRQSSKLPAWLGDSFHVHSLSHEESYETSKQAHLRGLQEESNNTVEEAKGSWVYSEYATVVPDPQQHLDESAQQALAEEWGRWSFWDGEENIRPTGNQYADYAYRDVPSDDFDDNAWTVDAVFVNHILDAGEKLVQRAQDAIFAEYGYGRNVNVDELLERNKMFHWEKVDMSSGAKPMHSSMIQGGWTTQRSADGLARRLLHAMMTNDEFVVVVVGAPWVAGIGNHFQQSYPMQMHRVLAPVLARLGVKLITRNLSSRYHGSLSAALGKLWGNNTDIDLLIWDAGKLERSRREKDAFLRQALLSGKEKIPVVWMGGTESDFELLRTYHEEAGVDVGRFGSALYGIPISTEKGMVASLPHAARYLNCDPTIHGVCIRPDDEYCAKCWINRPDISDPKSLFPNISSEVPGQYNWNPGWRQHQLTGRLLAYTLLDALQDAIHTFTIGTLGGPPLDDGEWHMASYYENIRSKLNSLQVETGCNEWKDILPERICSVRLQGATQHTPRVTRSLTDILRPGPDVVPSNPYHVMYEGYDVHNSCFDPPPGTPDVVGIVSGRRLVAKNTFTLEDIFLYSDESLLIDMPKAFARVQERRINEKNQSMQRGQHQRRLQESVAESSLQSGSGWQIVDESPGRCDGEYTSICGRHRSSICPLLGHHDSRGHLKGNDSSGWLVFVLDNLTNGIVIMGLRLTGGATGNTHVHQGSDYSMLDLPDSFVLDVSIDGAILTWNKEEFIKRFRPQVQLGFDALVVLDDDNFTTSSGVVEMGLRLRECGATCSLSISHIFWA